MVETEHPLQKNRANERYLGQLRFLIVVGGVVLIMAATVLTMLAE